MSHDSKSSESYQERDKSVYLFLLESLTDVEILSDTKNPNEYSIAQQWGQNRIFVRRVLRSIWHERYYNTEPHERLPNLTFSKLIEILLAIETYQEKKGEKTGDPETKKIITYSDKLQAIRKFTQLTLTEQQELKLRIGSERQLLEHLSDIVVNPVKGLNSKHCVAFFRNALKIYENLKEIEIEQGELKNYSFNHTEFIRYNVKKLLDDYYQESSADFKSQKVDKYAYQKTRADFKSQKVDEYAEKIQREIERIEFQAGIEQVRSELREETKDHLSSLFIYKLTCSLVENEILSEQFPVFLRSFEITKEPTLPLYFKQDGVSVDSKYGLLNPQLLEDEEKENFKSLAVQNVNRVKVYFTVKLPEDYEFRFEEDKSKKHSDFRDITTPEGKTERFLDFCEEVIGVGSLITHIIKTINQVTLWNIPELKDYLPAAREIFNKDEVVGERSSSVSSYSVVMLCKKEDILKTIEVNKQGKEETYDEIATHNDLSYGQFNGFDLVEASAQTALYARLRAIKQLGIKPKEYLTQLAYCIEEKNALKKAESYLESYPFSLKAMEGFLDDTLFDKRCRYRELEDDKAKNLRFQDCSNKQENLYHPCWSLVAYEAHIKLAQAYLREGLYRKAKEYLNIIQEHINNKYLDDNLIVAQYYLCCFRYHYLTDLDDFDHYKIGERAAAIREAEDSLRQAEEQLKQYLMMYDLIGEASQTNFHPFFYLFSRMLTHRLKLHLFFPHYASRPRREWSHLREALYCAEKARIYAARNGSSNSYSHWCSYQAFCYLIMAYSEPNQQLLNQEECLKWAEILVEDAKKTYSFTGKRYYQGIKQKGGKIAKNYQGKTNKNYESYGKVKIEIVPLLQEEEQFKEEIYNEDTNILTSDVTLLKDEDKSIYLFGVHSTIILFGMGLLELCRKNKDLETSPEEKIVEIFKNAKRLFIYTTAIAEEGGKYEDAQEFIINRKPKQSTASEIKNDIESTFDSFIRILYPHRINQFVDLGKIFAATCQVILILKDYKDKQKNETDCQEDYEKVKNLLENLQKNIVNSKHTDKNLAQLQFNGNFTSHFNTIKNYFNLVWEQKEYLTKFSLLQLRDKIVRDVFKIMQGDFDVRP